MTGLMGLTRYRLRSGKDVHELNPHRIVQKEMEASKKDHGSQMENAQH
jgi:hypothetical protein